MKKKLLALILVLSFLIPTFVIAGEHSIGSGEKTSDAAVVATSCKITSLGVFTDGTNDAKVVLYDNASAASGAVIWECTVNGGDHYGGRDWNFPRLCFNGIYADVTGTGASYIVEYTYE